MIHVKVNVRYGKKDHSYDLAFDGLVKMLSRWYADTSSEKIRRWAEEFMVVDTCPECAGQRLKQESLHFKIKDKKYLRCFRNGFSAFERMVSWN